MTKKKQSPVTVKFSDEEQAHATRGMLRELAEWMGCNQNEALYFILRYAKLLIEAIDLLEKAMPRPEMGLSIRTQLPHWRKIIQLKNDIKERK